MEEEEERRFHTELRTISPQENHDRPRLEMTRRVEEESLILWKSVCPVQLPYRLGYKAQLAT